MQIDLLDHRNFAGGHPHDQYDWLRENAPVHWHPEPDGTGFWVITRYQDVYDIGRNAATYSSEPTISIDDPSPEQAGLLGPYKMMLTMDPPAHTSYRKLISREFTQGPARAYNQRIEELASQIVDAVIDRGSCDFVTEVAGEMPSFVIADLMGLPIDDGRELYKLTELLHSSKDVVSAKAKTEAAMKMFAYGQEVIANKRANPGDDLASKLLQAELDGRKLEDAEFLLFFLLLVDAGGDTTRNLVATGMQTLLEHPDQLARLQSNPESLMASTREELLRWTSPVIYMRRTVQQDVTLRGQLLREGDKVVLYYGAANRDVDVFPDAHTFDITRTPNKHIAFGGGHHICLGQWFARLEIDAIMLEVLKRMGNFRSAGELAWMPSNFISGLTQMPLAFDAI